jgi:hypothetical protein
VVVLEVVGEQPAQVMFIEDDEVVEALAADTSGHPLGERILPGAPRSSEDLLKSQGLNASLNAGP